MKHRGAILTMVKSPAERTPLVSCSNRGKMTMHEAQSNRILVQSAREIIAQRFRHGYHHVGAALRTRSGRMFAAVHLEARTEGTDVCAEAVALGMAAATGDTDVERAVSVDADGAIILPCPVCRALIADYAPDAVFIIREHDDGTFEVVSVSDLLSGTYEGEE